MKRRSNMAPQRYARTGLLAVDPQAFLELFIVPSSRESELIGDVCVVDICGPIEQHDVGWSDSYEAIRARVAEACESSAKAIVLRVDSPGGACSGCFDTARAIRTMCAHARKPLYAYCDQATSAGYALASAASIICASDTATVGSIGVIETRHDYSAQNAAQGVRVEFIASGARKVDGRVDAPITDAEIAAKREIVDAVAGLFFALVEETRGIPAAKVAAMEAAVYHAEAARGVGLIDDVTTFESMLARIASGERIGAMATPYEDARAALEKAAKGDDPNAAAAKRALAAMNEGMAEGDDDESKPKPEGGDAEGDDAEGDDDKKDAEGDDDTDAEGDDEKPDAEGDDDKKDAAEGDDDSAPAPKKPAAGAPASTKSASTRSVALEALAKAHNLEAELRTTRTRDERVRLLNTRKDFSRELRAELMRDSTPIATVRSMVKNLKRGAVTTKPTTTTGAAPTRGAGQGDPTSAGSSPLSAEAADMDRRMGILDTAIGVTKTRNTLQFGVVHKPHEAPAAAGGGGAK